MKFDIVHTSHNTPSQTAEIVLSNAELATVQGGQCPYAQPLPPSACSNYYNNSAPNYSGQPSYAPSPNYGQNYGPNPNYGQNYGPSDTSGSCGNGSSTPSYNIIVTIPSYSSSPCGN